MERDANYIVIGLLGGERAASGLGVKPERQRGRILGREAIFHLPRPKPAGRAIFRDLFEKIVVRVKEKRQARRKVVHAQPRLDGGLDVSQSVVKRERELLHRARSGLADMVAADADRMIERRRLQ